jgi:hypothetical protein
VTRVKANANPVLLVAFCHSLLGLIFLWTTEDGNQSKAKQQKAKPTSSQRGPNAAFGTKKSTNPCANAGCGKYARVGSQYCSHNCGLAVAVAKVFDHSQIKQFDSFKKVIDPQRTRRGEEKF